MLLECTLLTFKSNKLGFRRFVSSKLTNFDDKALLWGSVMYVSKSTGLLIKFRTYKITHLD